LLFASTTIFWALIITVQEKHYDVLLIDNFDSEILPEQRHLIPNKLKFINSANIVFNWLQPFNVCSVPLTQTPVRLTLMLQFITADAVVVWRAWVLWENKKMATIVPLILLAGNIGLPYFSLYYQLQTSE
jgi:hypothetical protein